MQDVKPLVGFFSSWHDCTNIVYNRAMKKSDYIPIIAELSASERIFTTAQAERLGLTRRVLSDACRNGHLTRLFKGAYRATYTPPQYDDELACLWKLTDPASFSWERARADAWDGIAIGGPTAAALLGLGDYELSPYQLYAPKRIRSRTPGITFVVRKIEREDVEFTRGYPVTTPERTVADLLRDHDDPSIIASAFRSAMTKGCSPDKIERYLSPHQQALEVLHDIMRRP